MGFRVTGESITTTLVIKFTDSSSGIETLVNADATPTAKLFLSSTLLSTLSGSDVTNSTTGTYSVSWVAAASGQYNIVWTFLVDGVEYTQDEDVYVLDAAATSQTEGVPDIGIANMCNITGTFIDIGGNYKQGVHIRFSPTLVSEYNTSDGFIIDDITTESDKNGQVSFYLRRGIKGLLSIAGTGIVRQVTVPAESSKDIFELASEADDLLEVQNPNFYQVIKRS